MTPPVETKKREPEKAPDQALDAQARPGRPIEHGTHLESKDHRKDNAEFLSGLEKADAQKKRESLEQARQWQSGGDIDLLRAAGMSLEQVQANPLERHIKLATMFLERQTDRSGLSFRLNFGGQNEMAFNLDLADLLPSNNLTIDLYDQDGKVICRGAVRGFVDGRPGYFDPKDNHRLQAREGEIIEIRGTQSSMALRDPVYGQQTAQRQAEEQAYLLLNAQQTVLKNHARAEAAKSNQTVVTDQSFFDVFLADIAKAWNSSGLGDPKDLLKFDFSKLTEEFNKLLAAFGLSELAAGASSGTNSPSATASPSGTPQSSPSKAVAYRETKESQKSPKLTRKWLLENVGSNEREVQAKLVPITFLGAKIRVCKYIAPYLKEAEERAKAAGINYKADPKQTSCFNWRTIRGGSSTLSMHSWGVAIDINSIENPWQPRLRGDPKAREKAKSNLPPAFIAIMQDVGFRNLDFDPMHFEMAKIPTQNSHVLHSVAAQDLAAKYLV